MNWQHDESDLSIDPPVKRDEIPWDLWRHLKYAHGFNGGLRDTSGAMAKAAHHREHNLAPGDPGKFPTEPEVREPSWRWPWQAAR